jgi:thiol:disulfide interchange protein DsbD
MNTPSLAAFRAQLRPVGLFIVLLGVAGLASAKPWWMRGSTSNEQDFLPPDVAFRVAAYVDGNLLRVRWVIADGYYLYRRKIEVRAESPDLVVYPPVLPHGSTLTDVYFGPQEVYFQQVEATVAFSRIDGGAHPLQIKVIYQGCAQAGLCYPPIARVIFPAAAPIPLDAPKTSSHAWQFVAIIGGALAFLLAGLLLRKGRQLDMPSL